MQNYYIRIEDILSHISHKFLIIKYLVLKKIIFYFLYLDLDLDLDSNLFGLGLDSDSNLFGLGLDSDSNLFGLGLDSDSNLFGLRLDKGGLDYSSNLSPLKCLNADRSTSVSLTLCFRSKNKTLK